MNALRRWWFSLVFAVSAFASPELVFAADPALPDAAKVAAHLDKLYRADSSQGSMTMRIVTKQYRRELTMDAWSEGSKRSLVLIRAPAKERGTATLATDEGVWNYAPRSDRLIRLPSSLLSDSWMGSHFTNDDLVRKTSLEKDHKASVRWGTEAGARVLEVTLIPNENAPVAYTKIVEIVTAEDWMPIRADYFDKNKLVRQLNFRDPKNFSGRKLPSVIELVPSDKAGESTQLIYNDLKLNVPVDAAVFTAGGLRRIAHQ